MGRKRVESLLRGEGIDRPPVAAWRHFPQDDQDSAELATSVLAFQKAFNWDIVKVTPAQSYLAEVWGAQSTYTGDPMGIRDFTARPVKSVHDWRSLARPESIGPHLSVNRYLEAIEKVRAGVGDDDLVLATVFSPFSVARYLAGDELFAASVRRVPDDVRRFLNVAAALVSDVVQRAVGAGADGSFVSLFSAGSASFSEAEYRSVAGETDQVVFQAAQCGWFNVAHFHVAYPFLHMANEYPVQAISWDLHAGGPSVRDARRLCPEKVLIGGIDQRGWLLRGDPRDVEMRVRELVGPATDARLRSEKLIVAPGCTVLQTTPLGNLRAMRYGVER